MNENILNQPLALNIRKNGITYDNRQSYYINANDGRGPVDINITVKKEDVDTFEKCMSTISEFGERRKDPKELKKAKTKAYLTLFELSLAGVAIPAYFTRNSKTLTKILSIVGGASLGVISGIIGAIMCLMPKGYKEAKTAAQTLRTLDIKVEKDETNNL